MLRSTKILHYFKNLTSTGTRKLNDTIINVSISRSLLTSFTCVMGKQPNMQEKISCWEKKSCCWKERERKKEESREGEEMEAEERVAEQQVSQSSPSSRLAGSTNQ